MGFEKLQSKKHGVLLGLGADWVELMVQAASWEKEWTALEKNKKEIFRNLKVFREI